MPPTLIRSTSYSFLIGLCGLAKGSYQVQLSSPTMSTFSFVLTSLNSSQPVTFTDMIIFLFLYQQCVSPNRISHLI